MSACEIVVIHVAGRVIADAAMSMNPQRPEGSTGISKRSLTKPYPRKPARRLIWSGGWIGLDVGSETSDELDLVFNDRQ